MLLVEHGRIGGDCTFTGCVPSKTLIEAASAGASFDEAFAAVRDAVATIAATEDDAALAREGVPVLHGWASFLSPREVDVDGTVLRPRRVIVATGARPSVPRVPGLHDIDYLTSENVFDLDERPASLVVLGGGSIGCELAQAFRRLGVAVSVVDAADRLLPQAEPEASAVVADAFAAESIAVLTGVTVTRVERLRGKRAARLHLDDDTVVEGAAVLVATGREGAVDGLGLDAAGVKTERGFIVADDTLATTASSIWAVGDVAGRVQLTHAADEMGRIASANALSRLRRQRFHEEWIPTVTFTQPEVAHVGIAEREAAAHGGRVAYLPMAEVDRAVAAGATRGFVKLLVGPRPILRNAGGGKVVGATVVANRAGELIAEIALALRTGMFAGRLAQTVHPYPTWSTAVRQAAAQLFFEIGGRRARPARRFPDSR